VRENYSAVFRICETSSRKKVKMNTRKQLQSNYNGTSKQHEARELCIIKSKGKSSKSLNLACALDAKIVVIAPACKGFEFSGQLDSDSNDLQYEQRKNIQYLLTTLERWIQKSGTVEFKCISGFERWLF
jgi:hypothetical protein